MFVPCEQCPLRRKPLFRPFTEIELGFVREMKTDHIVVPPRADIIREDEIGGPVYTLFEGWAVRYHILPNGARQILDVVLPGDMIGLASVVLGRVKHSVQAITPVQRRDLADAAGLSRVHVARTLDSLRMRRLAEIQDGTLVIYNRAVLADLAGYVPLDQVSGRRAIL